MAKKENLRNRVTHQIKLDIIHGKYSKDAILTERELIERFQVSRSPVRDALVEHCNEGLLESIPRFGYRIKYYSSEYLESIWTFRKMVEPAYLELYWERISKSDIEELERLFEKQLDVDEEDVLTYWQINCDFHLALARFYHDDFFYEMLSNAMSRLMVAFSNYYWGHWNHSIFKAYTREHEKLIEHLKNGEKELAIQELRQDIENFMKE